MILKHFKDYREKGVPPTQVPDAVVEPSILLNEDSVIKV